MAMGIIHCLDKTSEIAILSSVFIEFLLQGWPFFFLRFRLIWRDDGLEILKHTDGHEQF